MAPLLRHAHRDDLIEVILDLGRRPQARFQGSAETLTDREITREDLAEAASQLGDFGEDNRAGIEGTLHRISAMRNRKGAIVGLTCRVGRAVVGHVDMIRDLLDVPTSLLFLGRPGVGKTTVIRELARTLADDLGKRVVIVDTSNEIGGDGDVCHPAVGGARRMQVPNPRRQHDIMIEAVENHMPEVIIVDEIGTEAEALACRTCAERGVQLIGTAHGQLLENLVKNPTLSDLLGGIESVTLGDDTARARNSQKAVLERRSPPTFPILVEIRERSLWVQHCVEDSVDALLRNELPYVQVRTRDPDTNEVVSRKSLYTDSNMNYLIPSSRGDSGDGSLSETDFDDALALHDAAHSGSGVGGQFSSGFLGDEGLDGWHGGSQAPKVTDANGLPIGFMDSIPDLDDSGVLSALSEGGALDGLALSGRKRRKDALRRTKVKACTRRRSRADA